MSTLIPRKATATLAKLAAQYPVVTITGPRQSGKTTLARFQFGDHRYVNLEAPDVRTFAVEDPREFLRQYPAPVIFDEIQNVPELLSYLQVMVDERAGENGLYVLTGSRQPELRAAVSQSLAGRTGLLHLLPLSLVELRETGVCEDRDVVLHKGLMPKIYSQNVEPLFLYRDYFHTYVERDVRQLINVRDLSVFETFMRLVAGRVGQVVNLSALGDDAGVSHVTVREWLSVLEASYVIFPLRPYFRNFNKRQIKAPKLYFVEPGLVAYLLGLTSAEQVARDPLLGGLFENLVVIEALKARYNSGADADLYFFRDSRGGEVDLLFVKGRQVLPVEIKAARTWSQGFFQNLKSFAKMSEDILPGAVIYAGDLTQGGGEAAERRGVNFREAAGLFV
ncbi:MAG: ATP-binding protein [Opitutaceae bacterium]|jgi:predicted AAA+ superfamily ATPase|nr:ATP-binding protein [Opitutaceae bacterium]